MMSACSETRHSNHPHKHGSGCGHTAVKHDAHVDYLHDGHLHHVCMAITSTSTSSP